MSAKDPIRTEDLARLYDEHSAAVHRLAYSLLSQQQEAEDLTHDVFLRLQRGGFDSDRSSIRSYLLLLTRSMGLNRLNQRRNRRRILQCFRPGLDITIPLIFMPLRPVSISSGPWLSSPPVNNRFLP